MAGFAIDRASPLTAQPEMPVGAAEPVPFWDAARAGADEFWTVRRGGAREEALRGEMWKRQTEIQRRTGQALTPSDLMNGDDAGVNKLIDAAVSPLQRLIGDEVTDAAYEAQVNGLRATHPKAMNGIESRAEILARLQRGWGETEQRASEAGGSTVGGLGVFAGGAGASFVEPENLAVTALTGPIGAGRSLATRMLMQAAANAGVEATQVPGRMVDAAKYGGPKYGLGEAAQDVAGAGVAGGAFEGGAAAVKAVARPLIRQFAGGGDGALRRAAAVAEQAATDDAAIGVRGGAEHAQAAQALATMAPPPAVEPARDLTQLFAPGDGATEYRGRTIRAARFDPKAVDVDPATFQYKADGDAAGVTARLKGVEAWDATASGKVIVYEDRAGRQVIADGHQRRALALRMEQKGWDAPLDGYLFREADGWSPAEVRTVAALKNIREGQGSPLDAAKVFRQAPEAIADTSLPVTGEFIAQGRGLAQLSDEAFGMVVNKVLPERYGAEIGAMAPQRPELHADMVRLLKVGDPANVDEARAMVVEALQDDWVRHDGAQEDLFGYDPSISAMVARAKIAASVKRGLAADARLFGQLVRNADAIEAGGNALARDQNEARLAIDRAALEVTAKLALRSGPIGEAMADAVKRVHGGEAAATAARRVLERVRAAVEAGERFDEARLDLLDPKPPAPQAEALLEGFDAPGGKGAVAQAIAAPEDAAVEAGEAAPGLFDDLAVDTRHADAHQLLLACAPGGME